VKPTPNRVLPAFVLVVVLLVGGLAIMGCAVRFISDYDDVLD
jgi:hypothetical protein